MYDAIEFRGNSQADVEELAAHAGCRCTTGVTNEWHPTQMLADFLTMHESSNKPYHGLAYAFVGDCRFNMGPLPAGHGRAEWASDVRLAGPAELHRPRTWSTWPRTSPGGPARGSPAPRIPGKPSRGSTSSTPMCGLDGRGQGRVGRPGQTADALPGQLGPAEGLREPGPSSSCMPAGLPRPEHHRRTGDHGAHRHDRRPRGDPARSSTPRPASCSTQAENQPAHHIKAILVATLG